MDLESLLSTNSSHTGSLFDLSSLLEPLMPFLILITVVSLLIGVLYVFNAVTMYRSHKAMIETRDIFCAK